MKTNISPVFTRPVFESIRQTIGILRPETGGMLCGDLKTQTITFFHFDKLAVCSPVGYSPDTKTLNKLLVRLNAEGLRMLGFVHSHPLGFNQPSGGDLFYCKKMFAANPELPFLVIPIINSSETGRPFRIRVFVARPKGGKVQIDHIPLNVVEAAKLLPEIKITVTATHQLIS